MSKLNAFLWMKLHKLSPAMTEWLTQVLPTGGSCKDVDALLGSILHGAIKIARADGELSNEEWYRIDGRKQNNQPIIVQPCKEWAVDGCCRRGDWCTYIHAQRQY